MLLELLPTGWVPHYTVRLDGTEDDDTGFIWTFLDEALELASITPGALVVDGDESIVHLRMLPGPVVGYVAAGAAPSSLNRSDAP